MIVTRDRLDIELKKFLEWLLENTNLELDKELIK